MAGPETSGAPREEPRADTLQAVPDGYPTEWECDSVLADGRPVHIRPVRPDDADEIVRFHAALSEESIYLRFFSALKRLPDALLQRFTHVDYDSRMVLLALFGDQVIAMASYDRTPGKKVAEVAFAVADAHHGRGLATLLLEHLSEIARSRGIESFTADTLPHNRAMLQVFRNAGYRIESAPDHGTVHIRFPIAPTSESRGKLEAREHRAEAESVARLLAPKVIAVVGAGPTAGKIGHEILRNLVAGGFRGQLHPVHPTAQTVLGLPVHRRVSEIPGAVDLAVIAVPAPQVREVVEDCADKQVYGIVVISAGFAESGDAGAAAERELVAFARANGMRMVGPNCMGIANTSPAVAMNATFAPTAPAPGRVGFYSQSGALGIAILERSATTGAFGISSFVSVGNKADVSGNDLLQYWEEDPATAVLLLYLEAVGNPRKFARLARRISRTKPIVALKGGISEGGRRGALSHTAALASPDAAVDALCAQAGIVRVHSMQDLFDIAELLSTQPLPHGRRVAIVGNSGGPGILAADACERNGLIVPELFPATQERLRRLLLPGAGVRNPVDLVAAATPQHYEAAIQVLLAEPGIDSLLVVYTPPRVSQPEEVAAAIARSAQGAGARPMVASFLSTSPIPRAFSVSPERGSAPRVPCFAFPEQAAHALARAATYAEWRARPVGREVVLSAVDAVGARRCVDRAVAGAPGGRWLSSEDAGTLLACYGIPVVPTLRVASVEEAVSAAQRLGRRVTLKAGNPELVHKSNVGGVALDLASPEEVRAAFLTMRERLGEAMGGALVQPMLAAGVETIVGVTQDPSFGPLILFGIGGVAVELLQDQAFRILPLTDRDAEELVRGLKTSPLLFGYRGAPPVNVRALEDFLLRVA
ncbi:MAG TPA: GNAT family N-acetyltransferase, partial [Myxococcota bacterium]|nr:GNAT family N-acetyltransferase [Myxococcota bacterium]